MSHDTLEDSKITVFVIAHETVAYSTKGHGGPQIERLTTAINHTGADVLGWASIHGSMADLVSTASAEPTALPQIREALRHMLEMFPPRRPDDLTPANAEAWCAGQLPELRRHFERFVTAVSIALDGNEPDNISRLNAAYLAAAAFAETINAFTDTVIDVDVDTSLKEGEPVH